MFDFILRYPMEYQLTGLILYSALATFNMQNSYIDMKWGTVVVTAIVLIWFWPLVFAAIILFALMRVSTPRLRTLSVWLRRKHAVTPYYTPHSIVEAVGILSRMERHKEFALKPLAQALSDHTRVAELIVKYWLGEGSTLRDDFVNRGLVYGEPDMARALLIAAHRRLTGGNDNILDIVKTRWRTHDDFS